MAEATGRRKKKSALQGKGGLVAIGAVVVLGIWLIADLRGAKPREAGTPPPMTDFLHMSSGDVAKVEVKREKDGFTLVRQGDNWSFEAPGKYRANPESVKTWLKGLVDDASIAREIEGKPSEMSNYGLDKPQYELVLTGKGGDVRTLQVGKEFPQVTSAGYFAREAKDGRLFLLGSTQVTDIKDKKIEDLRDKRLLPIKDEKEVGKITIQRGAEQLEVVHKGEKWEVTQPISAPAEGSDVSTLLDQVKRDADSFAKDEEMAKAGLDKPRLVVRVEDKDGTRAIWFGNATKDKKVYAAREGENELALVSETEFDSLDKQARLGMLRERKLLTLDRDKITFIELQTRGGTTRLQKTGANEWQLQDEKKKARADRVQQVLDAITSTATQHIEEAPKDLAKYGLDKPSITVRVNEGTGTSRIVMFGKKTKAGYYAKGEPNAVFEVASFNYENLDVKPAAFKEEEPKK